MYTNPTKRLTIFLFFCLLSLPVFTQDFSIYDKQIPIKIGAHYYDYQNYHNIAYFHGGLDLVAPHGTTVYTPVSGMVEVLDYQINTTFNPPSFQYVRKPFKRGSVSSTRYLEVAVTDHKSGHIWMFRHIAPMSVPSEIYDAVESKTPIKAGTKIGAVAAWIQPVLPEKNNYDHIHLEIHDFEGNYVNPAQFIKLDKDFYPPTCKELYVVNATTNEALLYSAQPISGKIKFAISVNDRMNSSRYLHSAYKAKWSLFKILNTQEKQLVLEKNVFEFTSLPFKGDRTQLSKVIYFDSLKIASSSMRIRANANNGPRIFLINLNAGSPQEGYSEHQSLDTTSFANGDYELNITIEDFSLNKREKSFKLKIAN